MTIGVSQGHVTAVQIQYLTDRGTATLKRLKACALKFGGSDVLNRFLVLSQ